MKRFKSHIKSLVLAAALLPAFGSAFAEDQTHNIVLNGGPIHWSTGLSTTHAIGDFTDTWTFTYSGAPGLATGFFGNIFNGVSDIDFTSATLNGTDLFTYNVPLLSGSVFAAEPVSGVLTLIVSGTTTGGVASYGGTLDITSAVPEPSTYGMLLGGLSILAFLARRRKS